MATSDRRTKTDVKGGNLMPMGMGEAEIARIKEINQFNVDQTKALFGGILEMTAVKNQIGTQEAQGLLRNIETFMDPWVQDIARGGAQFNISGTMVSSNIAVSHE